MIYLEVKHYRYKGLELTTTMTGFVHKYHIIMHEEQMHILNFKRHYKTVISPSNKVAKIAAVL